LSIGVVPRDVDADEVRSVRCDVGSAELLCGVCMPDGVDWPLSDFPVTDEEVEVFDVRRAIGILDPRELPGAGLAAPDRGLDAGDTPFDFVADDVTPNFVGRDGVTDDGVRRVGMRE